MAAALQDILDAVRGLSPDERVELLTALQHQALADSAHGKREIVMAIQGKYSHVPTSSDEFIARKHEELAAEG